MFRSTVIASRSMRLVECCAPCKARVEIPREASAKRNWPGRKPTPESTSRTGSCQLVNAFEPPPARLLLAWLLLRSRRRCLVASAGRAEAEFVWARVGLLLEKRNMGGTGRRGGRAGPASSRAELAHDYSSNEKGIAHVPISSREVRACVLP